VQNIKISNGMNINDFCPLNPVSSHWAFAGMENYAHMSHGTDCACRRGTGKCTSSLETIGIGIHKDYENAQYFCAAKKTVQGKSTPLSVWI
jgi:hypothetical protein